MNPEDLDAEEQAAIAKEERDCDIMDRILHDEITERDVHTYMVRLFSQEQCKDTIQRLYESYSIGNTTPRIYVSPSFNSGNGIFTIPRVVYVTTAKRFINNKFVFNTITINDEPNGTLVDEFENVSKIKLEENYE